MVVQQELHDVPAQPLDLGGVCPDHHAVSDRVAARRNGVPHPLHVDDADAASPLHGQPGMMAEPRNVDPRLVGRFHDGRAAIGFYPDAINC